MNLVKAVAASTLFLTAPLAAADAPKPDIRTLIDTSYSGDASMHAVVAMVEWPVGADTDWHTHPGDEYATILEGEIAVITKEGGAQRLLIYKAGDAYHNRRDVVHLARNAGKAPAKTLIVMIAEKDKPLSQAVR
ncbi:MAG: cupin domain-containing protein [Alphaproteobacteria bacterium]